MLHIHINQKQSLQYHSQATELNFMTGLTLTDFNFTHAMLKNASQHPALGDPISYQSH